MHITFKKTKTPGHRRRQLSAIRIGLEYRILLIRLKRVAITSCMEHPAFKSQYYPFLLQLSSPKPNSWQLPNNCQGKNASQTWLTPFRCWWRSRCSLNVWRNSTQLPQQKRSSSFAFLRSPWNNVAYTSLVLVAPHLMWNNYDERRWVITPRHKSCSLTFWESLVTKLEQLIGGSCPMIPWN